MYGKESFLDYLQKYNELAAKIGCSKVGLACRWVVWDSALRVELGDSFIPGASTAKQLQEVIDEIEKGPLDDWVVGKLEDMWKDVEDDASTDNFSTFKRLREAGML